MPRVNRYETPGKPVTHPPVLCIETGQVFKTFKEAAEATGGTKNGVFMCCRGLQREHHGFHYIFTEEG